MEGYRPKRESLEPSDAKRMRPQRASIPRNFDSEAMVFRNAQRSSLASSGSVGSMDSSSSWRSSNGSLMSSYTIPTQYSSHSRPNPSSVRSSYRSSNATSLLMRPASKMNISVWKRLPQEVYDCIFDQLEELHTDPLSPSCDTCYMRDLQSLALTSRGWDKAVRRKLYCSIHIVGLDSPGQLKKYKLKHGSRLRLLRRTLRERKVLANYVHELKVPDLDIPPLLPNGKRNVQYEEYRDLVASIVMACPNLERLIGFHKPYHHDFDRLTHALSTRRNLKEHIWIITQNAVVTNRSHYQLPPGLLDDDQVYQFLQYHSNWHNLETLLLYSPEPAGILEHDVFVRTFRLLPSLRHLCISGFDADDFTDATLVSLPPLMSLRLEALPGITDAGLTTYASNSASTSLRSLTLVHQNVDSLLAICKLLASLTLLEKFTLVQHPCPALPMGLLIMQPLLVSYSLKKLHWDISSPPPPNPDTFFGPSLSPNAHLAHSILAGGFPSLQTLRSPSDICPPGALQAVCRPTPNAQIMLASDKYSLPPSASRGLSVYATSRSARNNAPEPLGPGSSLQLARRRAQTLIDSTVSASLTCRPGDFIRVIVTDHSAPAAPPPKLTINTNIPPITGTVVPSRIMSPPTDRRVPIMPSAASISAIARVNTPPARNSFIGGSNPTSPTISNSPPSSPTQPKPHTEVSFPRFLGRIDPTALNPPPKFVLIPDIPGNDADGGVVGFADLLRGSAAGGGGGVSGRRKDGMAWYIRDGCTGTWNQSSVLGKGWWGHVERERGAEPGVRMMF